MIINLLSDTNIFNFQHIILLMAFLQLFCAAAGLILKPSSIPHSRPFLLAFPFLLERLIA
jgi:hypothetical protein